MNESFDTPPPINSILSGLGRGPDPAEPPLGEAENDRAPIASLVQATEALLREPRRVLYQLTQPMARRLVGNLILVTLVAALIYGLVIGTFSGGGQLLAASVKTAGGLFLSALICLPSLYIFACLGGGKGRLSEVFGLLAAFLALMTILLIGFAPVAWVFSQSTASVAAMGTLHLVFWLIATGFGLRLLIRGFRHHGAHVHTLQIWAIIFLLVALQMTTALRPLIGTAPTFLPETKQFFVAHWEEAFK